MSRTISGVNGQISLNPATDDPTYVTGTISASGVTALYAPSGATWTITNTGSIRAPNSGGIGVNVSSTGTLINGPSSGGSGYVLGGSVGVLFSSAVGTVVNFGKIEGAGDYSYGVDLAQGGAITNGSTGATGALIAAYGRYVTGIRVDGGGTVRNFGTIIGATGSTNGSYGIISTGGGTIVNGASGSTAALITGSEEGVHLNDVSTTTVINYGTINGSGLDAIRELSSGNLTVINSGLLSGNNHAILFGNGTNRLIVHPGAAFQGDVETNSGSGLTVELATGSGTGTIGGFGSNFIDFSTVQVDSGAHWTITGSNSLASGTTLTDSGTLTNSGTLANSGTLIDAGTLVNAGKIIGGVTLNTAALLSVTSSGSVNNNGTGKAIFGGAATVVNDGRVVATGANGGYGYQGIYLGGGSVNNTGAITAFGNAILLQGAGTITNSGTVSGGRVGRYVAGLHHHYQQWNALRRLARGRPVSWRLYQ
jgi:fibronectin-binding autotransporter adhesin